MKTIKRTDYTNVYSISELKNKIGHGIEQWWFRSDNGRNVILTRKKANTNGVEILFNYEVTFS